MKWTLDASNPAGKIQVNRFNKAWNAMNAEHATTRELTGIIGKLPNPDGSYTPDAEGSHSSMLLFSGAKRDGKKVVLHASEADARKAAI